MSTLRQQSNPWLMRQKLDKARRFSEEVRSAIRLRNKHVANIPQLWMDVLHNLDTANQALSNTVDILDAIREYNNQVESTKI